jgi:NAD(P)H-dependent flavin oxidoreductase YrpB (nitropropane dioxygenase family)
MKSLKIGNLKSKLPIIQGGMGIGISLSGLSSSVANQGGVGVIATAGIGMSEPDFYTNFYESNIRALRKHIQKARQLSNGIIGVNIMVALSNFSDMVKTAIEEKIDIIFSGAGLPLDLPKYLKEKSVTKLVPIVSSGKAARLIAQRWLKQYNYAPDAIVVEGPKAGGHLGFKPDQIDKPEFSLKKLVKDVLNDIKPIEEKAGKKIPVIAAGGIYTGKDIYEMIELGASGVQMATRFVPTIECDASDKFKQSYINAKKEDIGIIKSPVGLPGRAIINDFIKSTMEGKKKPYKCPYHCIVTCNYKESPYCIAHALMNAKKGNLNSGFAFAGENAYRTESIISVKELIDSLNNEYKNAATSQITL